MRIRKIDHVGINVHDLPAAKAFFLDLGLEMIGEAEVEGEWVERIIGLNHVKEDICMLRTSDGNVNIELIQFHTPQDEQGIQASFANTLGIRHVAFEVEDVDALVSKLQAKGVELVGEVVNYKNKYKLCYCRGPEGILLELAEPIT
ncbi:VOC family protein [Alkalihalobacillus pseudalcaliphilus]|uniref:VOC family protein n=1 Tax=Alkalihalobacillus pseudalcaliphilus TaxID=79884 RepID=UPI00064DB332|nr:VOC family protein [Alkalihalobacillus pseudalcaliphilus]KMK76788.1 glyoxalase [Alkalihalobacillus pseudalcaliphilus]